MELLDHLSDVHGPGVTKKYVHSIQFHHIFNLHMFYFYLFILSIFLLHYLAKPRCRPPNLFGAVLIPRHIYHTTITTETLSRFYSPQDKKKCWFCIAMIIAGLIYLWHQYTNRAKGWCPLSRLYHHVIFPEYTRVIRFTYLRISINKKSL